MREKLNVELVNKEKENDKMTLRDSKKRKIANSINIEDVNKKIKSIINKNQFSFHHYFPYKSSTPFKIPLSFFFMLLNIYF
jgi:hypothetical protein